MTYFPAQADEVEMNRIKAFRRKDTLQIHMGFFDVQIDIPQPQPASGPVNMRINWKGGFTQRKTKHDGSCLWSNTFKMLQAILALDRRPNPLKNQDQDIPAPY